MVYCRVGFQNQLKYTSNIDANISLFISYFLLFLSLYYPLAYKFLQSSLLTWKPDGSFRQKLNGNCNLPPPFRTHGLGLVRGAVVGIAFYVNGRLSCLYLDWLLGSQVLEHFMQVWIPTSSYQCSCGLFTLTETGNENETACMADQCLYWQYKFMWSGATEPNVTYG